MSILASTEKMRFTSQYPAVGTGPIPVEPVISPELFERERTAIFHKVWLKVGRVEEIPTPGDYKVKQIEVARTSVILIRDKNGSVNAYHNICPHRGNKLIHETGNETFGRAKANVMSCRFHGWVFDSEGLTRSIPREECFSDIDKSCIKLSRVHCDVWEGFIFVNFSENPEQSLLEYLGGIGEHYANYPGYAESTCSYRYSAIVNCNWKVALYAFTESYHVATIHAATFPSMAKLENIDFKLFGPHSTSGLYVRPVEGIKAAPSTAVFDKLLRESKDHQARLEELPKDINPTRRTDFQFEFPTFFPNFLLHVGAGNGYAGLTYFTHQFWPISYNQTLWEGASYFRQPTRPSERIAIAHVNALHRNAWLEDTSTMEDTQQALESRVIHQMHLMDEELMIRNTNYHCQLYMNK